MEGARKVVQKGDEQLAHFNELKIVSGCRGLSVPIAFLQYSDATAFMEYPVAHYMALSLHNQFMRQMRDVLGEDAFNNDCKRVDKRAIYILRSSDLKRLAKRMLSSMVLIF